MDTVMLDNLVNIVLNDTNNDNEYKNFDKLLNTLSENEVKYFIEQCGEKIFENDTLTLIMWDTHPILFNDYITSFIDKKIKIIDYDLAQLEVKLQNEEISEEEHNQIASGYLIAKTHITELKNNFISNIIHFLKPKKQ